MSICEVHESKSNELFVILSDEEQEEIQQEEKQINYCDEDKSNQEEMESLYMVGETSKHFRNSGRRHTANDFTQKMKQNQIYEKYKNKSPMGSQKKKQIFTNKLITKVQNQEDNLKFPDCFENSEQVLNMKRLIKLNLYKQAQLQIKLINLKAKNQVSEIAKYQYKEDQSNLQTQLISLMKQLKNIKRNMKQKWINKQRNINQSLSNQVSYEFLPNENQKLSKSLDLETLSSSQNESFMSNSQQNPNKKQKKKKFKKN